MKENPCFHRHHYENTTDSPEFAKHTDIVRGHNKWLRDTWEEFLNMIPKKQQTASKNCSF